jgi:hypothetical protein
MTYEYEVGHGKPPKDTQWSKGQSGNPKGRPKTKHEFLNTCAEILSEPVTAKTSNGNSVSLGSLEASYFSLCKKALKGENSALFAALKIILDILPRGEEEQEERDSEVRGAKERFRILAGIPIDGNLSED